MDDCQRPEIEASACSRSRWTLRIIAERVTIASAARNGESAHAHRGVRRGDEAARLRAFRFGGRKMYSVR